MTPDKSKTMDAAEKLMLDLMEKHPGASESSLLALFQNAARERPEVLRAIVGNFMKHSSVQYPGGGVVEVECLLVALFGHPTCTDEHPLLGVNSRRTGWP
jgi:hypothetical protein